MKRISWLQIVILFLLLASIFSGTQSFANDSGAIQFPEKNIDGLERGIDDRVLRVVDPLTLDLAQNGLSRIVGLDIPDFEPYYTGPLAQSALKILEDMLVKKEVRVYQTRDRNKGRSNRMGHTLLHIVLDDSDSWVQGVLVRLGLARVRTDPSNAHLARDLYKLEEMARAEKLGLWAFEDYKVLNVDEAGEHFNSFQIVEGTVKGVARQQNNIFINFGNNWRDDFTVSVAPSDLRKFTESKMHPQDYLNKTIRVRGWLREYNGPYMEIDHPERVEIIK